MRLPFKGHNGLRFTRSPPASEVYLQASGLPREPQAHLHCAPQKKKQSKRHCVHCEKTIVPIVVKKSAPQAHPPSTCRTVQSAPSLIVQPLY